MTVQHDAFSPEELRIIRYYLTPRRPTWDYWLSHALYFVVPTAAVLYGIIAANIVSMALGMVGVLLYLLYLIHAGAHYNRMFHNIIPKYEGLLEVAKLDAQAPRGRS